MNQLLGEQILVNYGGIEQNNLMHIIQEHITEIDNIPNLQSSIYVSNNDLQAKLNVFNDNFTVLSLNCQSLPAKFDKIHLLVEELKLKEFEFSALCFHETWLNENSDTSLYLACLLGFKNTTISPKHHEPIFYRIFIEIALNIPLF